MSRYIDADAIKRELQVWATNLGNPKWFGKDEAEIVIDFAPSIDIVRCKECRYWNTKGCRDGVGECEWAYYMTKPNDYCSYGERSEP